MLEPVVSINQIHLEKFNFVIVFGPWQYWGGKEAQALVCTYVRRKIVEVIEKCNVARNIQSAHLHYVSERKTESQEQCSRCNSIARKKIGLRTVKWIKLNKGNYAYPILKNCGGLLLCENSDPSFGLTEFKGRTVGRHRYIEWRKSSVLCLDQERRLNHVLERICLEITQTEQDNASNFITKYTFWNSCHWI